MFNFIAGFIVAIVIVTFAPPKYAALPSTWLRAAVTRVRDWLQFKADE